MNVFISYRRSDTQDLAGRIADRLRAVPGIAKVFFDTTAIAPGADFVARIEADLSRKPVCIILIGPAWRGPVDAPRIFDPSDVVRLEVTRMFERGLRMLPVLANGAEMPSPRELPENLQKLANLNATSVRHESFERDLGALIDAIRSRPDGPTPAVEHRTLAAMLLRALISFLLSSAGLLVAAALHHAIAQRSLAETLGGPGQVWLLILGVPALGTLAGVLMWRGRRRVPADREDVLSAG
jgi:hypothetical protein